MEKSRKLTAATRKAAPRRVEWTYQMKDEFVVLRNSLCGIGVLTVPVSSDVFVLQTDASGCGISGVLSVYRTVRSLPVGSTPGS